MSDVLGCRLFHFIVLVVCKACISECVVWKWKRELHVLSESLCECFELHCFAIGNVLEK